ncbi:MAG: molybdopterin-dependent oxidoreductase, partial [Myxococcales bacterium]|nr:molybdopterin-dependent oxidoreductase [Myxococcales bacterium]
MSKQPTTHRRAFIIGSTAIAGGVAFGLYTLSRPHKNPLEAQLDEGELTFNPWVKINANGVILIAPHTDLGQGARSLQAALIAEEMDLELHQFTVETGPPAGAYWNTAVANNIAPFMARDRSLASNTTRRVVSSAVHLLGVQITGGSTTAADVYNKLRVAGAVARETLKLAAAAQAEIPVSELRTAKGAVILPDNRVIPYTRLAEVAANISPVTNVDLRPPSEWRLVGKDMLRLDIKEKSTGTSIYGIDISMPDMVHATVCTNPRIGGTMNSYDASEAKDMPGVKAILKISNGVAVIANNTWNAISAAKSIQFDWGPAPYPPEIETHWNMLSDSFREENLDGEWRNEGHIDETLTKNTPTRTLEYRAPYLAHAPLEPLNATIKMTSDRIEIWASHQVPRMVQNIISRITGISTENI